MLSSEDNQVISSEKAGKNREVVEKKIFIIDFHSKKKHLVFSK
jgi:hypothetical protein